MRLRIRFPLRHPFHPDWISTPARSARGRCEALSGTVPELAKAAASGVSVQRALFVLHRPDCRFLNEEEREQLWQLFQVPAFALLLDGDGRLVGYECEAQQGLHVPSSCTHGSDNLLGLENEDSILGYRVPWNLVELDQSPCECGRPGPRLRFTSTRASARRRFPRNELSFA